MTSLEKGVQPLATATSSVYDFSAPLLDGRTISLAEFKGRVLLIVNTASKCGFTPQYAGLEELYRAHRDRGFEVLGFPCNQFGNQEPGSAAEIAAFCEQNYDVSFPMFAKVDVNGVATHPLFQFLKASRPGLFGLERIKWNFTKFLVDRTGRVVDRLSPATKPSEFAPLVEQLLNQ
jgi:glutathione peroxidase